MSIEYKKLFLNSNISYTFKLAHEYIVDGPVLKLDFVCFIPQARTFAITELLYICFDKRGENSAYSSKVSDIQLTYAVSVDDRAQALNTGDSPAELKN